jgi:hypothetical protein
VLYLWINNKSKLGTVLSPHCVAFPIAFCFNLYCGGFILFCNVFVCVCVCACVCECVCVGFVMRVFVTVL